MPKSKIAWDRTRAVDEIASYEWVPAPSEMVRPYIGLQEPLPHALMNVILCALEDPQQPAACALCIIACLHAIDAGPTPLLNQQIIRYNYHDVYTRCTRFLMRKRTQKQQKRTEELMSSCNCYGDRLGNALVERYRCDKPGVHNHAAGDMVLCEHHPDAEYIGIRLRAKLEDFLMQLHVFINTIGTLEGLQLSMKDVMDQIGTAVLAAIQPLHEGVQKLYNFGKNNAKQRRQMWPRSPDELLPYGVEESMFSLGRLSAQLSCYSAMGIAGVIMDVVRGPSLKAFMDSAHLSGAFVTLMSGVMDTQKQLLVIAATKELDSMDSLRAAVSLRDIKRVALVAHMLCVPEIDRVRFNTQAKLQSGICDALEITDKLLRAIVNFRFLFPGESDMEKLTKIAEDAYSSYAMLGGALHRSLRRPYDTAVYHEHILKSSRMSRSLIDHDQAARSSRTTTPEGYRALAMRTYGAIMDFTEIRRCWNKTCTQMEMLAGHKFQRCSCCKAVRYCSPACQRAAWDTHQIPCKLMRAKDTLKLMDLPLDSMTRFPSQASVDKLCRDLELSREDLLVIVDHHKLLASPHD